MRTALFCTVLGMAPWLAAQESGVVNSHNHQDYLVPARPGDESPMRFAPRESIDWSRAQPLRPPPSRPAPKGFVNRGLSLDVATGVESVSSLPVSPPMSQFWVSGSPPRGQVLEPDSWSSDLTAVSAVTFPWRAQCRVFVRLAGQTGYGSGTLIDPRTVMTAGHVLHEGNGGNWATDVWVAPNWDGDDDQWGRANATQLYTYDGWAVAGDRNHDIGYIRLDRPVGYLTDWLGYGFDSNNSFFRNTTFNLAAYPGLRNLGVNCSYPGAPDQQYRGSGTFDTVSANFLRASVGWTCEVHGMSGGGIYHQSGSDRYVYGTLSGGAVNNGRITSIGCARMDQAKFDDLSLTVIPGGYGNRLDLIPLDVDTTASKRAGARLSSLDYLVCNASDNNPGSATYRVKVYLSTNTNISTGDTLIQSHSFTWNFSPRSTVRVNVPTPPRIPMDTPPGRYYIGVILEVADANTSNNDTDGWDAARIAVHRSFPSLPSSFAFVGSNGRVIDFEGLASGPSYFAINRLNSNTLGNITWGWVNYGQLATCIDPFRGSSNLELGNHPGGGVRDPDTIAALVIGLNGRDGRSFEMDFMLADCGEELDDWDGIWISQDGDRWYTLTPAGWGLLHPIGTSRWYSVRNMQLTGATPVDTDDDFYLAFVAQDDYPYRGLDGIGIDDIRIHQPFDPTMTVSNFYSGSTALLCFNAGSPRGLGGLVYSISGPGPLPTPIGTVALTSPLITHAFRSLTQDGNASVGFAIPSGFRGVPIWFQGIDATTLTLTNPLDVRVK